MRGQLAGLLVDMPLRAAGLAQRLMQLFLLGASRRTGGLCLQPARMQRCDGLCRAMGLQALQISHCSLQRLPGLIQGLAGLGVCMGGLRSLGLPVLQGLQRGVAGVELAQRSLQLCSLGFQLGAFALGPVYGVVISFMKNLLHIVVKGTSTACVGELCNFMLGAVFSAVAGFIYKHHKSRKTAILGAAAGAAAMALFSVPSNYFITYPAYVQFYHMPLEAILGMYQAILPSADSLIKCLVIFNMPFTLVKGLLDAVLCLLIYKPLSPILHGRK